MNELEALDDRPLLVTGAAGFIGSALVRQLLGQTRAPVVSFDALTYAGNEANLQSLSGSDNFRFVHADICDYDRVLATLREHSINTIVHFAAESHVDRSITGPDAFIETNVTGTHVLQSGDDGRQMQFVPGPVFTAIFRPAKSISEHLQRLKKNNGKL